jgi:poly-gamma-glutamate synthesis protein (capsule biosynthesis protein)
VPRTVDVGGVSVGHVAYTRYANTVRPAQRWRQSYAATSSQVIEDVRALRAQEADIVIVSVHISKEMLLMPIPRDRDFATAITAGSDIDLVVHHGPHVVQPLEMVNGTPVYWSTGNMLAGMGKPSSGRYADQRTLDGLLAMVQFVERSNGNWDTYAGTIAICTDPVTRIVRPARSSLENPSSGLTQRERNELTLCLQRTAAVVTPVG